ncbi:palmitoyltransferase ZDHHC6-like [Lingula anatina]|uniref:Palmitoyltransferase n=1 Tax=Lingula anatina TaxID=7574 RepID=A0A1S3HZZ4_LINAN|nr:palmitoyltransferase ZDHHC6-like [Lingula anatina]|eukprot:XP_013391587.1 palmitoyltransferase ZDHHC6-like [Lingula anatina]
MSSDADVLTTVKLETPTMKYDPRHRASSEGSLMRLVHWGPLIALYIIFHISLSGLYCILMWWPPFTVGGAIHLAVYLFWLYLVLYNMISGSLKGPGFVPLGWKPDNPEDFKNLQYCRICEGYKAPRSHHCRKCNRCVMKMDHHCPWINTCCGHYNHASFIQFLFIAPVGCFHAAVVLIASVYRAVYRPYYLYFGDGTEPLVELDVLGFLVCMFGIGLAIGVIIAVGMLFVVQMKSVFRNETGIETWIKDKAYYRDRDEEEEGEFIYPYDLGRKKNFFQVFSWSGFPVSDGIWWEVREGCDQYTLTVEQLKQKEEKRERALPYVIVEDYAGSIFPISKGCRVCCSPPCSDEPRIPVRIGDKISVTRWRKHWMYGDKLLSDEEAKGKNRVRGWFPKRCARHDPQDGIYLTKNHDSPKNDKKYD